MFYYYFSLIVFLFSSRFLGRKRIFLLFYLISFINSHLRQGCIKLPFPSAEYDLIRIKDTTTTTRNRFKLSEKDIKSKKGKGNGMKREREGKEEKKGKGKESKKS